MTILIGVNLYAASDDAAQRQANAVRSMRELADCRLMNLQFVRGVPFEVDGLATAVELELDGPGVTGRTGAQKPIVSEMLDLLGRHAAKYGCEYIAVTNSDILIRQPAIDTILVRGLDAYLFSRTEVEANGAMANVVFGGVDLVCVRAEWWLRNRRRFQPYILGEPVWDNVYTSQILCHSRGVLLQDPGLILHERHPQNWRKSPYAQYTRLLAALDAQYFSLWVRYWERVVEREASTRGPEHREAQQREIFVYRPTIGSWLKQRARNVKARARYRAYSLMNRSAK